jgi:hypothetical protein
MGALAEGGLAAAMNPTCLRGNHAAVHLERQVVDWFKELLGFPAGSTPTKSRARPTPRQLAW